MGKDSSKTSFKEFIKKVFSILWNNKKKFQTTFIVVMAVSTLFFLKFVFFPTYTANYTLISKYIKFDQVNKNIELYNNCIDNPKLNKLDSSLKGVFKTMNLKKIKISEVKTNDDLLKKDNDDKFKIYNVCLFFKNVNCIKDFDSLNKKIIEDIQIFSVKDNRIIIEKEELKVGINEVDSILNIAKSAGISYTHNLENSKGAQLMVMSDLYSGINNLLIEKIELERSLKLLNKENIIYKSTQIIFLNKIEYPWIALLVGVFIWIVIVFVWTFILFKFENN